jgi:hypothetical protein
MMWILLGTPDVALPIPLWVQGGAPPEALNGTDGSEVCDEAIAVREFVRHDPYNENAVNTFRLARVLDILAPTESLIFRAVADSEAAWPQGPSPEQAANLTAWCTNVVLDAYLGLWDELNHQGWGITIPHEPKYKPGPNITRDTIHVSVPASGVSGVVRICDITGRTLTSMPYGPGPSVVTWIPRDLPSGSYFAVYPAATGLAPTRLTIIR